jgi:hypothetical protein
LALLSISWAAHTNHAYAAVSYGFATMLAEGMAFQMNRTTFWWEFFCVTLPVIAVIILVFKKVRPEASSNISST